jgi:ketosteroid isomerase-like protein
VPTSKELVSEFVAAINSHDVQRITALCTPQHRFVDSLGAVVTGRDALRNAWTAYLDMFPNYTVTIDSMVESDDLVLLSGWAAGTLRARDAGWRIPAAWRAQVRDNLIESWQVFADNKPVYELLQRDV